MTVCLFQTRYQDLNLYPLPRVDGISREELLVLRRKINHDFFRDALHQKLLEQAEQLSEKSTALSQASKTSSEILKRRVKAETQKTRIRYQEERAALEKQKAATDIDIWLSKEKEAAAIANAELSEMEYYDRGSQGSILLDLEQEQTAQEIT